MTYKQASSYHPFGIGFNQMFKELDRIIQFSTPGNSGFPPFDIEAINETNHRITMAVAGFSDKEIGISLKNNILTVEGDNLADEKTSTLIYKGIAKRSFRKEFVLAEHVNVEKASIKDGLLVIDLLQTIPEERQSKKILVTKE